LDLNKIRKKAVEIARTGGNSTLGHFNKRIDITFKEDNSPVTIADQNAEEIIRAEINKHFPGHGIIGEEFGVENENSTVVWVIDPIDGTQSFIHGFPTFTTLIGVLVDGIPQVGVIYAPALNEMVSASVGGGCFLNGERVNVRKCRDLNHATLLTTDVTHIYKHKFDKPFKELLNSVRIHRTWGDAYGHLMVATGRADIMFDPILKVWDAAALLPVVTEAGGSYTDVNGNETIETGNAISTNLILKSEILAFFE